MGLEESYEGSYEKGTFYFNENVNYGIMFQNDSKKINKK